MRKNYIAIYNMSLSVTCIIFIGFILFIMIGMTQTNNRGGYLTQDYGHTGNPIGTSRYKCAANAAFTALASSFLINEAIDNLVKSEKYGDVEFLKEHREAILDVDVPVDLGNVCDIPADLEDRHRILVYREWSTTPGFAFRVYGFLKVALGHPDAQYGDMSEEGIFQQAYNACQWTIQDITPVLGEAKIMATIVKNPPYKYDSCSEMISILTTTINPRTGNPIIPVFMWGDKRHFVAYIYNSRMKKWVEYDDAAESEWRGLYKFDFPDFYKYLKTAPSSALIAFLRKEDQDLLQFDNPKELDNQIDLYGYQMMGKSYGITPKFTKQIFPKTTRQE